MNPDVDALLDRPLDLALVGVDERLPVAGRMLAAGLLIQAGVRAHRGEPREDIAGYRDSTIDAFGIDERCATDVVIWADRQVDQWVGEDPDHEPTADVWSGAAVRIAKRLAGGVDRRAAVTFAAMTPGQAGRNRLARDRPVAAAMGAASRAAAVAVLLPGTDRRMRKLAEQWTGPNGRWNPGG